MIINRLLNLSRIKNDVSLTSPPQWLIDYLGGESTSSGQTVTPETSRTVASAYRCGDIISNDVAKMPLKVFNRRSNQINQVEPDPVLRNLAYLLEISPNRYQWTPFLFKKALMQWLLYWGNAYVWQPPGWPRQLLILPANKTEPVFDKYENLWYKTEISGVTRYLPMVEVMHTLINPDQTGYLGRSVITYARESIGRQLGAHETMGKFYKNGLNPSGLLWVNGDVDKAARDKIKEQYASVMGGSENAYNLAVFDNKITKFEPVTMKPIDMQFLESTQATDTDIANFFGVPLYKLNSGKQSYQSNEQQNLDYLTTTLDPHLVQLEQAGRLKWIAEREQGFTYLKFIRDALLRTDSKTRADYKRTLIESGQMTPNEARSLDDMSPYPDGDAYYMASNIAQIGGGNGE